MNKLLILSFISLLAMNTYGQKDYVSQVWNPDNGDGTFTNPVLNADYSDPDVVAVGLLSYGEFL